MSLCEVCQRITLENLQQASELPFYEHLKLDDLRISANACHLCDLLFTALCKEYIVERRLPTDAQSIKTAGTSLTPQYPAPTQVRLSLNEIRRNYINERSTLFPKTQSSLYVALCGTTIPMPLLVTKLDVFQYLTAFALGLVPEEKTDRSKTFDQVRQMLAKNHHESTAGAQMGARVVPRRLLEIFDDGDEMGMKLRLIVTKELIDTGAGYENMSWTALSWRWGRGLTLKTEHGTLSTHLKGIEFASLPRTFQDAVSVTHMLNIEYLWIDALCIIQDDPQDWREESAIMGHIYAHSYCTLTAHSAEDWSTGFLDASFSRATPITLGGTNSDSATFAVSEPPDFVMDVEHSHLSTRGWIVQERMLPSRILHFTQGQIHWETNDELGIWTGCQFSVFKPSKPSRPIILHPNSRPQSSPISWFNIIERYTDCALTVETDKLIAIEGLARLTRESHNVPYLAGLWQDRLHTGLLWAAKKPMKQPTIEVRALSWSWACLEGPVQYPLNFEHRISELATSDIEFLGLEFDGMPAPQNLNFVNGPGALRLRAEVIRVLMSKTPRAGRLPQRIPLCFQSPAPIADSSGRRLRTLSDVATEHKLGCVTSPEQLHEVGYGLVGVVSDPEIDEETAVRYVVDADTNPIGWAAMDEEDDADSRAQTDGRGETFGQVFCMKVATLTEDAPPGVRATGVDGLNHFMPPRSYVLFLEGLFMKNYHDGSRVGVFRRLGMGCVQGKAPFASASKMDVLLI